MKKISEILSNCLLFDGIEECDLLKMLPCLGARVVEFDKKYTVFAEGSEAKYIGIVLSGSAQMIKYDYYGNKSIISETMPGGMLIEEFASANVISLPVSVIANEPCEIMIIDVSRVLHTCKNGCAFHSRLIYNLMKALANKTLVYHERIEITSKRTTREKLLAYLASIAKKEGRASFDIPFDRQELADYLEVDRSGLSLEIGKLVKEGIIENKKKHFRLK